MLTCLRYRERSRSRSRDRSRERRDRSRSGERRRERSEDRGGGGRRERSDSRDNRWRHSSHPLAWSDINIVSGGVATAPTALTIKENYCKNFQDVPITN